MISSEPSILNDPVLLCEWLWPWDTFYSAQREVLYAARCAAEVMVQAGNELGKDWVLGRLALAMMVSPWTFYGMEHFAQLERMKRPDDPEYIAHQRRVVTTSVKDKHLDVLWGEIGTAWRTCSQDLSARFVMTHHEIRFKDEAEAKNAASYLIGVVSGSANFEGLTGHHAKYTLALSDESSGADDGVYKAFSTWAARQVHIGNPLPCNNYFKKLCRAGDLKIEDADSSLIVGAR
jgi:hypothetical protein